MEHNLYNTKYNVVYDKIRPSITHNFLSDKEIKEIINDKDLIKASKSGVIDEVGLSKDIRDVTISQLLINEKSNKYGWLQERIFNHIKRIINDSDFPAIEVHSVNQIELLKYTAGGKYLWHSDIDFNTNTSHMQRKFSAVIALNDRDVDFTGGYLKLKDFYNMADPLDKNYLRPGSIVVFPSYMRHIATPVTSGTRYSIVAWAEGPYWR